MRWPEMPIVKLVLPVAAGIVLESLLALPTGGLTAACVLSLAVLVGLHFRLRQWHHRNLYGIALWISGFLLGMCLPCLQQKGDLQTGENAEAFVAEILQQFPTRSAWKRMRVRVSYNLHPGGYWTRSRGRLELFIQDDTLARQLRPGDQLLFTSGIRPISSTGNPEAFDYAAYLARRQIYHQAFLRSGTWHPLPAQAGLPWRRNLDALRARALERLRQALPDSTSYGLAAALLLGSKGQLPRELKEQYAEVGVAHVLAVSGLHVGILAFGLLFSLQHLPLPRRLKRPLALYASLATLAVYALITGLPASVQRAVLMYGIVLIGKFTALKGNSFNSLGVAALLMLSLDSALLFDLGFQYSFLALFGILFFQPLLAGAVLISQPWLKKLWDLTVLGVAANLTTFPLTLYYFHDFPVYFWLSSLFVTFLVTLVLYVGFLFLLLGSLPVLGWVLGRSLDLLLQLSNSLVFGLTQLPGHTLSGIWLDEIDLLLLYSSIALLVWTLGKGRKTGLYLILGCLLLVTIKGIFRAVRAGQQRELVVYQLEPGKTALDLMEGRRVYGFSLGDPSRQDLAYARDNYRIRRRIREGREFGRPDSLLQLGQLVAHQNGMQFCGWRILLLDQLKGNPPPEPWPVDILIWRGRHPPEADQLRQWIRPRWIVLDGSLPRWTAEQCRQQWAGCEWKIHSIRHDGAFLLSLKNR